MLLLCMVSNLPLVILIHAVSFCSLSTLVVHTIIVFISLHATHILILFTATSFVTSQTVFYCNNSNIDSVDLLQIQNINTLL